MFSSTRMVSCPLESPFIWPASLCCHVGLKMFSLLLVYTHAVFSSTRMVSCPLESPFIWPASLCCHVGLKMFSLLLVYRDHFQARIGAATIVARSDIPDHLFKPWRVGMVMPMDCTLQCMWRLFLGQLPCCCSGCGIW